MEKVTRDAFLYLEPKSRDDKGTFAQCWSCRLFVPEIEGSEGGRCVIHGSKFHVGADDTCGFYVDWPTPKGEPNLEVVKQHAEELAKGLAGSVTPEESSFTDAKVQCFRCAFAKNEGTKCGLYMHLNRQASSMFDLDEKIKPNACCNAWKPTEETEASETRARVKLAGLRAKKAS